MRRLLLLAIALVSVTALRADIPLPIPTSFSLTGLANAPKCTFSYTTEEGIEKLQPIKAEEVYRAQKDIRLYVREGDSSPQQFATLKHEYRGLTYVVRVEGVKRSFGFGKLEVQHHIEKTPPAPYKGNGPVQPPPPKGSDLRSSPALPYFALAGVSLVGLVVFRRRM